MRLAAVCAAAAAFAAPLAHAGVSRMPVRKTPLTRAGLEQGVPLTRGVLGRLLSEHAGVGGNGRVPISTLEDAQYYGASRCAWGRRASVCPLLPLPPAARDPPRAPLAPQAPSAGALPR